MDDRSHDALYWKNWVPISIVALFFACFGGWKYVEYHRINDHFKVTIAPHDMIRAVDIRDCSAEVIVMHEKGGSDRIEGNLTLVNEHPASLVRDVVVRFRSTSADGKLLHEDFRAWHGLELGPGGQAQVFFNDRHVNGNADALTFDRVNETRTLACEVFAKTYRPHRPADPHKKDQ